MKLKETWMFSVMILFLILVKRH